jgi:hypothetical protein
MCHDHHYHQLTDGCFFPVRLLYRLPLLLPMLKLPRRKPQKPCPSWQKRFDNSASYTSGHAFTNPIGSHYDEEEDAALIWTKMHTLLAAHLQ